MMMNPAVYFSARLIQPNEFTTYYSRSIRLKILDTILLLKRPRYAVKEIKQQLANRDPAKMLHILEEREHQINTKIAKLRSMEKMDLAAKEQDPFRYAR